MGIAFFFFLNGICRCWKRRICWWLVLFEQLEQRCDVTGTFRHVFGPRLVQAQQRREVERLACRFIDFLCRNAFSRSRSECQRACRSVCTQTPVTHARAHTQSSVFRWMLQKKNTTSTCSSLPVITSRSFLNTCLKKEKDFNHFLFVFVV